MIFFQLEQELEQVKETRETSEKQLSELKGERGCMYMKIKQAEMVDVLALRKADSCTCIDYVQHHPYSVMCVSLLGQSRMQRWRGLVLLCKRV